MTSFIISYTSAKKNIIPISIHILIPNKYNIFILSTSPFGNKYAHTRVLTIAISIN